MKVLLAALVTVVSMNCFAFSETGSSHKSCEKAQRDALTMADGHCVGIDTEGVTKVRFGRCSEQKVLKHKTYKINIYYTCKMPEFDKDYDTFAQN